jgi:hypothetical protein
MKRTAVALIVAAFLLAGCGSGGGSSGESTAASVSPAAAKRQKKEANAICTRMVTEAHRLGTKALAIDTTRYESTIEFTTEALIAPAVPVIERSARELREVRGEGGEPHLDAYVAIFDPILSLLEERIHAGRQGDTEEAHQIETQLIELGQVQEALAKEAGLPACEVSLVGAFAHAKG